MVPESQVLPFIRFSSYNATIPTRELTYALVDHTVSKVCGHVLCQPCCKRFVSVSKRCFVCEEKTKEKDWIPLQTEGTGFIGSSGEKALAMKKGIAFQ